MHFKAFNTNASLKIADTTTKMSKSSLSTPIKQCTYVRCCGYKYASAKPYSFAKYSQ